MKLPAGHTAALSVALGQQSPDVRFDAEKVRLIAEAIAGFSPSRQAELEVAVHAGEHALVPFVNAVEGHVNTGGDGKPRSEQPVPVSPKDVAGGFYYFRAQHNPELKAAVESGDWQQAKVLLSGPQTSEGLGLEWTTRLHKAAQNQVDVRLSSKAQIDSGLIELGTLIKAIAGATGPERDALRTKAADAFAQLVVSMALAPWGVRADGVPHLDQLTQQLAEAGVPGALGARSERTFTLEGLGLSVSTRLRADPAATRWAALAWQLERRGDDPNAYRPGSDTPAIMLAADQKFLGRAGAPIGFVSKDEKFVFVPSEVDVSVIEHRKTPYGIQEERLGLLEYPREDFHLESALRGVALKLPVEIALGGQKYRLEHGRYVGKEGEVLSATADGSSLRLAHKRGDTLTIDTKTGQSQT